MYSHTSPSHTRQYHSNDFEASTTDQDTIQHLNTTTDTHEYEHDGYYAICFDEYAYQHVRNSMASNQLQEGELAVSQPDRSLLHTAQCDHIGVHAIW